MATIDDTDGLNLFRGADVTRLIIIGNLLVHFFSVFLIATECPAYTIPISMAIMHLTWMGCIYRVFVSDRSERFRAKFKQLFAVNTLDVVFFLVTFTLVPKPSKTIHGSTLRRMINIYSDIFHIVWVEWFTLLFDKSISPLDLAWLFLTDRLYIYFMWCLASAYVLSRWPYYEQVYNGDFFESPLLQQNGTVQPVVEPKAKKDK